MNNNTNKRIILKAILLVVILAVTVVSYSRIFGLDFQRIWGDDLYLLNERIQDFSLNNIVSYFTGFFAGNYHPLTTLSFAINYQIFGLNPTVFHVENLIVHLVNIILVFFLINKLTKNLEIAVIVALFFGIHPMHVESVSWISGRKDLIYSLFFLISLLAYYQYISKELKRKFYFLSLIMFLLSLLSKSMAVTLPIVLLIIDYYHNRIFTKRTLLEKLPFFALSIIFGIIAIVGHESADAAEIVSKYSFGDRFFLISYGILSYIVMLFYPLRQFSQSAIHYYPEKIDSLFPIEYYIAPAILLVIILLILVFRRYRKGLLFGFLFFLITISVVLQLIQIDNSIISERYTYLPYIGLFFILAYIYNQLANKTKYRRILKPVLIIILLGLGVTFAIKTSIRNKVWKDSITLFGNVARRYPDKGEPLCMKGIARYKVKDVRGSVLDLKAALYNDPYLIDASFYRGMGRHDLSLYEPALADFNIVIAYDSLYTKAYQNRGATYIAMEQYQEAINDLDKAISLDPEYIEAYKNRSVAKYKLGLHGDALNDIDKAIKMKPDYGEAYYYRGLIHQKMEKSEDACSDWKKSDSLGYKEAKSIIIEHCK